MDACNFVGPRRCGLGAIPTRRNQRPPQHHDDCSNEDEHPDARALNPWIERNEQSRGPQQQGHDEVPIVGTTDDGGHRTEREPRKKQQADGDESITAPPTAHHRHDSAHEQGQRAQRTDPAAHGDGKDRRERVVVQLKPGDVREQR